MTILASVSAKFAVVSNIFTAGERKTAEWKSDQPLRTVLAHSQGRDHHMHGGEFFAGLRVFLGALDRYNDGLTAVNKLKLVVQEQRGDMLRPLMMQRYPGNTLMQLSGLGLQRMGRVHPGYFFRDGEGNTGFDFGTNGNKSRFTCEEGASFSAFADQLLSRRAPTAARDFTAV